MLITDLHRLLGRCGPQLQTCCPVSLFIPSIAFLHLAPWKDVNQCLEFARPIQSMHRQRDWAYRSKLISSDMSLVCVRSPAISSPADHHRISLNLCIIPPPPPPTHTHTHTPREKEDQKRIVFLKKKKKRIDKT